MKGINNAIDSPLSTHSYCGATKGSLWLLMLRVKVHLNHKCQIYSIGISEP